ncbi:TPA: hypothetical protein SMP18_001248 [Proteus mirabilis]|nr:hypothetical protein [Proteus mirabilis]HEK0562017.1 hypothetical protein [Proteus mirabilis]HEK3187632.1 hypothetical protein [Proteus mirabilis]
MFKFLSKKDTLLLAVISAASYSAAYLYEFSYAKYFNYPKELISISLVNLLRMGFSFFMLMLFSIFIIDFCTKATDALGKYGSNIRKAYAPITMGIILLIFLYLAGISIFKYYLIGMAIFIVFLILSTFFEKNKIKNNDENQSDNDKPKESGDLSATTKILSFFMLLFFSYGFILALGTYNARTTTSFYYFTADNKDYAIINKFDDNVITKVINKDKKLEDNVYIYKSDSLNSKEIKYIKMIEDNN